MSDPIREKFDELTGLWMALSDDEFKSKVIDCVVPVKIMEQFYRYCVREGLTRIEDLPTEKKRELYNQAKLWKPDGDSNYLTILCRVIWLRENILNV